MNLALSDEHRLLRQTAAEFVRSKSSLKRVRALRDSGDAAGFSRDLWHEVAALGWTGIVLPEKYGGSGLDTLASVVLAEELGRSTFGGFAITVLVHNDNIGRRSLGHPGSFRKGVVVLNKRFDLEKGLIVEGRIQARSLTNRLQNWRQTCAGIYIEGTGTGPGTAILLEVGDPQWRKSHIGRLRLDTDFHFESLDITGSNCATVNGLDDAKEHTFRLWMRGGLMELYVDDLLMQSFFYYSPSGRIGFISQESEARFSQLKFYEMNFADQE